MSGIDQILPQDVYAAAISANAPSAANPYATIADIVGGGTNWATGNQVLSGNRVHDFDSNSITENNVSGYITNLESAANRIINWDNGAGVTIASGAGANPAGFTGGGASTTFMDTPAGTKSWGGIWNNGGNAQITYSVYDPGFSTDEAGYIAEFASAGGNSTQSAIYHLEYASGDQTGFQANVFGERLLSQSLSITKLSAVDASAGFAFISGAGATGYIRPADQDGFESWIGSTLDETLAEVLATGNVTGGTNISMSSPDRIVFNGGDASIGWDDNIADYLTIVVDGDGLLIGNSADVAIDRGIQIGGNSGVIMKGIAPSLVFSDPVVGFDGNLEVANLGQVRTWTLPDEDGEILVALGAGLISDPAGGATVDAEARAAIVQIIDFLES